MDITPFYELKNRLYYAAAAGCFTISEDYRFKRAAESFEPLSKANKAFLKLYDMCMSLISSKSPSAEISDCIALADALAVTQGVYSDNDKVYYVPENSCKPADIPLYIINDINEKINKASEALEEIPKSYAKYLRDPRIMSNFLDYMENGRETPEFRFFAEIVCAKIMGKEMAHILKASVKQSGKQIKYVRELCGAEENEWYLSLIKNAENPEGVRKEAAAALSCSESNAEKLIELYNTEKGKVKTEALLALARLSPPEAEPIFKKLCDKYKKGNIKYISESHGEECTKFAEKRLAELLENCAANKYNNKELKDALNNFSEEWELLINKTDESMDDLIISIFETDSIALSVYKYNKFSYFVSEALIRGLKGERFDETAAQLERLYEKKPKFFQAAKTFVDFIKNPEGKINARSNYYDTVWMMLNIRYIPLLEKYRIGWPCFEDIGKSYELPLIIIGDRFPQSVIDFCTESCGYIIEKLEKIENGFSGIFGAFEKKINLPRIKFIDNYDTEIKKAVGITEYYLMHIFTLLTPKRYSESDSQRLIDAGLDIAAKTVSAGAFSAAASFISNYYKGSDEELIKLNTKYVMSSVKYGNNMESPIVLVYDKPAEVLKAAAEDVEKESAAIEKDAGISEKKLEAFKAKIAETWEYINKKQEV